MADLKTDKELSEEEHMKQMAEQMREIQVFLPEDIELLRTEEVFRAKREWRIRPQSFSFESGKFHTSGRPDPQRCQRTGRRSLPARKGLQLQRILQKILTQR